MKRTIIIGLFFIIIGFFIGTSIYKNVYSSINEIVKEQEKYYFLQEGIYKSKESLTKNTTNLDQKVIIKKDNLYYVYLGITKDQDNLNKLENIYTEKNISFQVKEKPITNEEFITNLTQFDLLLKETSTPDEILAIEEVVLANYDEIMNK